MYLSRMKLDLTKRETLKALTDPGRIHGVVERSFPGERQRNLWRIDTLNGGYYLMILSPQRPNLKEAVDRFGNADAEPAFETKDYDPLLARIRPGMELRFRLTANPVNSVGNRSAGSDVSDRGIVMAHITPKHQKDWLMKRSEKNGFSLAETEFDVTSSRWYKFKYHDSPRPITLLGVTYEGLLTVTDAELFRHILVNGLGKGKPYGMGLMTVMGTLG